MTRASKDQVDEWLTLATHLEAPVGKIVRGFTGLALEVAALREFESKFAKMLVYAQQLEARLEAAEQKKAVAR